MEVSMIQYPPGDSRMIDTIVHQLKSQGIFDQFRKECIADVDTKPAYQNLHQRVEGTVSGFLSHQIWRPDLNKNQLRESLRKHIHESGFLDMGVERIVDQVVNPKIMTVLVPQVEDVVYKFLGIEKPKKNPEIQTYNFHSLHERKEVGLVDLLPKDLDPVSPESDEMKKSDLSVEDGEVDEDKGLDDEESPPFEALADINDNSVESQLSGISGLTSPDSADHNSNLSFTAVRSPPPLTNENNDSQLSRVSSGSRLSISFGDERSPVKVAFPMEIDSSEGSSSESSLSTRLGVEEKVGSSAWESSMTTGSDEFSSPGAEGKLDEGKPDEGKPDEGKPDGRKPDASPFTVAKLEPPSPKPVFIKPKRDITEAEKEVVRKDYEKRARNEVELEKTKKDKDPMKSTKKHEEKVKEERKVGPKKVHDEEKLVKKEKEKKVVKKDKEFDKTVKKKEFTIVKDDERRIEKEELKKKDKSQGRESVKKIEKESKDKEVKKSDKHKSVKKDDHRSSKSDESRNDKVVKKEDVKVCKPARKDEKEENIMRKEDHIVKKEDHTMKKEEHTMKKEEHTMKKEDHTIKKEEHSLKKDEQTTKKEDHTVKKDEQTTKKEDHTVKKDEYSLKREEQTTKKEDHTIKKEEHSLKKDEQTMKKDDHTVKKDEQTTKKEEKTKMNSVKKDSNSRSSSAHRSDKDKHHNSKSSRHEETGKFKSSEKHISKDDKNKTNGKSESKDKSSRSSEKSIRDKDKKPSKEKCQLKSASDKEKEGKRKDKSKLVNDHDKHREKRPDDRRSTDRDSNGTTRDRSASSTQTTTSSRDAQRHENKEGKKGTKSNGGGNTESSEVHQEPKGRSSDQVKSSRKRPVEVEATTNGEEGGVKIKMPKIANNIYEVQKIIRLRKSLAKQELRRRQELLDSYEILPKEEGEDAPEEGFKYFEPWCSEEKNKFVAYIQRIGRSRRLSELSVDSIEENDLEMFSISCLPREDYLHHNLPVPSVEYVDLDPKVKPQQAKIPKLILPRPREPRQIEEVILPATIPASEEASPSVEEAGPTEMKPPDTISPPSRENRRSRKPNTKYSSEDYSLVSDDLDVILPPEKKSPSSAHKRGVQHPRLVIKRPKGDMESEVVTPVCVASVDNNNKDENAMGNETAGTRVQAAKKKVKLGPSRRIGLTRPKTAREIVRVSTPDFVMPLSPESDVSASSSELAKKMLQEPSPSTSEEEIIPAVVGNEVKKIQRRSSALVTKGQRYTSDDLYKPRPLFNRMTRRTRGISPLADEVAEPTKQAVVIPQRKR